MSFFGAHLLSAIIFLPLLGAVIALSFPRNDHSGVRGFALAVTLADLALAAWMWLRFDAAQSGMQLVESVEWIPSFGIRYALGVDGLAVLLVVLTAFLSPIVVLSTYSSVTKRARDYIVSLLLLQAGMLGAFLATDLFLFYVFWELMLIPMYFLIGIWGGERRIYAALKFFLYTMAGSLLMLVAILYAVWAVRDQGGLTFSWEELARRTAGGELGGAEMLLFLAFALAFAIKVPMFPFHTWLPDAHVEAPTGGSVILAGVMLKLGTFGFLRYAFYLFPKAAAEMLPAIGLLAVIGIIYGALVAMVQSDLKRLVAYSSVSHLGFVMLGLGAMTVTGLSGGVLQMVNHGISTGALFLLVGVIYERRHTRAIAEFGGLARVMPRYALLFVLITLSSIGLPGLNGFVGEFMILVGAFQARGTPVDATTGEVAWAGMLAAQAVAAAGVVLLALAISKQSSERVGRPTKLAVIAGALAAALALVAPPVGDYAGGLLIQPLAGARQSGAPFAESFAVLAVIAASGVIFAAIYMLWATQRVFFGPVTRADNEHLRDLSGRELLVLAPLAIVAVLTGLFPQPLLDAVTPTMTAYAEHVRSAGGLPALASITPSALPARRPAPPPELPPAAVAPSLFVPAAPPAEAPRLAPPFVQPQRVHPVKRPGILPYRQRLERLRRKQ